MSHSRIWWWKEYIINVLILSFYYRYIWRHWRDIYIGKIDDYTYYGENRYRSYPVRHGIIIGLKK